MVYYITPFYFLEGIDMEFNLNELLLHYNFLKTELKQQLFLIDIFSVSDEDNLDEKVRIRFYNNAVEDLKKIIIEIYKTLKIFNKKVNKI